MRKLHFKDRPKHSWHTIKIFIGVKNLLNGVIHLFIGHLEEIKKGPLN